MTRLAHSLHTFLRAQRPRLLVGTVLAAASLSAGVGLAVATPASAAGSYATTAAVNVRTGPGTSFPVASSAGAGAGFTLVCQWQGGTNVGGNATWDYVRFNSNGNVGAIADYYTTTPSFNSYAPGTGACTTDQMRNAAIWAIAEKNSPNPRWSDHYGHAWSGYCEQFAEQAEGFTPPFPTAYAHYQWHLARGRIHTDASPPVGAVVFYNGAGGAGHVAISIGGGLVVGTLGGVGDNLPVQQYPVIGFLSNPYLGWAYPIGS